MSGETHERTCMRVGRHADLMLLHPRANVPIQQMEHTNPGTGEYSRVPVFFFAYAMSKVVFFPSGRIFALASSGFDIVAL